MNQNAEAPPAQSRTTVGMPAPTTPLKDRRSVPPARGQSRRSGSPSSTKSHPPVRPSGAAPAANVPGAKLERHVGQIRARLELLTSRVETVEKRAEDPRRVRDLDSLKRDMVRAMALAERGGTVKDHLNRLTRRVDGLEGGAQKEDAEAAVQTRISQVASKGAEARDRLEGRLEGRLEAIQAQLGAVLGEFTGLTERLEALESRLDGADDRLGGVEERLDALRGRLDAKPPVSVAAPHSMEGDDLQRIKGIGPKYARALHVAGVTSWAQIADWSDADTVATAAALDIKPARIVKAGWIASAQALIQEG